jgi:hypothetical protein
MGILDHNRSWRFTLTASPDDCLTAFGRAFTSGGHLLKAKWKINRSSRGAVATYEGRAGLAKFATAMSARGTNEEEGAVGSQVTFRVEQDAGTRTQCTMWLSSSGKQLGFTADARFIRPYMRAVETTLGALDGEMVVEKS